MAKNKAEETTVEEEYDLQDNNNEESNALDLDAIDSLSLDHERDEQEAKRLALPRGDYRKDERWEPRRSVNEEDSQPGDIGLKLPEGKRYKGRTYIQFGGRLTKVIDGVEHSGYISFSISPDSRDKKNYDSHGNIIEDEDDDKAKKPDRAFKLYLDAKRLYETHNEEQPKTLGQLETFLADEDYTININQFNDSNFVMQLKPLRKRR